jgi:3-methyladenine DNA glycosylase Mpg
VAGIEHMAKARGIVGGRATSPDQAERSSAVAGAHGNSGCAISKETDRKKISFLKKLSSGPGRMSEALEITRARDNGKNLVSPRSDLRIVDDGYRVRRVTITPRIGIVKSAAQPLRYFIAENLFVSGKRL